MSQVILSIALPLPMIALLICSRRRPTSMGAFVNSRLTHAIAIGATVIVLALNAVLILDTLGVPVPGLLVRGPVPPDGISGSCGRKRTLRRQTVMYANDPKRTARTMS